MGNDQGKGGRGKEGAPSSYAAKPDTTGITSNPSEKILKMAFEKYASRLPSGQDKILYKADFGERIFSALPELGELVFDWGVRARGRNVTSKEGVNCEAYVAACSEITSATSDSQITQLYFNMFLQASTDKLSLEDVSKLLSLCRRVSFLSLLDNTELNDTEEDAVFQAICRSLVKPESSGVDVSDFCSWYNRLSPRVLKDLHSYVVNHLNGQASENKSSDQDQPSANNPHKRGTADSILSHCQANGSTGLNQSSLWLCSNLLPLSYIPVTNEVTAAAAAVCSQDIDSNLERLCKQQGWHVLYSSSLHGLSVNGFQNRVLDYKGHTLFFVSFDKFLYAVAVDQPWKESRSRWGGSDCLFFQILPEYRVCQTGESMMHYNVQDRTVPKGIHIGREPRTTFLKLDSEMINVNYYGIDYRLKTVEVWGCGGSEKLEAFYKQKQWEKQEVVKHQNRKLIPEDWRESVDRKILEMGGVETDHAQRGDL